MFAKLFTALVLAVLIGASVFDLRQQRLELMHEVTDIQRQMNRDRQSTWDIQVRIAEHTRPEALREALARAGMQMEPAVTPPPTSQDTDRPTVSTRHE